MVLKHVRLSLEDFLRRKGFQCGMKQQRFYKVDCITFTQETRFLHETLRDVQRV